MRTKILQEKWVAIAAGWLMILGGFFAWSYLSYDLLFERHKEWFYRVNALVHEHPEPGVLTDPLFWLASAAGNLLIFGLPCAAVAYLFVERFGPQVVGWTIGTALVLSFGNKVLLWMSPTTTEIKLAAAGDLLLATLAAGIFLLIGRRLGRS